jgi:hypothetical protein
MRFSDALMSASSRGGGPAPALPSGSQLLAVIDFNAPGTITLNGGFVQAITDSVTGTSFAQGTAANRPVAPVNGWAAFDGVNDTLEYTAGAIAWPNSGEFEVWAVTDYTQGAATYQIVAWPNSTAGFGFIMRAALNTGGVVQAIVGNGVANTTLSNPQAFGGKHVARAMVYSDIFATEVDGVRASTTAVVPAFGGATRYRIGASAGGAAGGFFPGSIRYIAITTRLPDGTAAKMYESLAAMRDAA